MKAHLIRPEVQRVETIDLPHRNGDKDDRVLEAIYRALGIEDGSRLIEGHSLRKLGINYNDTLYVDEEARIRSNNGRSMFSIGPVVFIGRGLVLRVNTRDNWVSPRIQRHELMNHVVWILG